MFCSRSARSLWHSLPAMPFASSTSIDAANVNAIVALGSGDDDTLPATNLSAGENIHALVFFCDREYYYETRKLTRTHIDSYIVTSDS